MLSLVAGLLLTAAPVTIAAPGLRSYGVDPKLVDAWLDRTITVLSNHGVRVTSHSDLEQAIGLERQRELLGCADNASGSCLAELAGALGVDALLVGSVVRGESGFTVTLRMVNARNGQELVAATGRSKDEAGLLDWLDETAPQLAAKVQSAVGHGDDVGLSGTGTPTLVRWSPAIGGAAVVVVGAVLLGLAQHTAGQLAKPGAFKSGADIDAAASQGSTFQTVGWVLTGVGLAAVAAGVAWGLLGAPSDGAHVGLWVAHDGAFAMVGGTFP